MKNFIMISVFIFGFISGSYFGFMRAPEEFLYWESQFNASLLVHEINGLEKGSLDPSELKEIELDEELANFGRYKKSKLSWVFPLIRGPSFDSKYITAAVKYRKENPHVSPFSSVKKWDGEKNQNLIDKVLAEY